MNTSQGQTNNLFLKLPYDFRLLIYDQLFRSTRLRWGTRAKQQDFSRPLDTLDSTIQQLSASDWGDVRSFRWRPAEHSLAILRVCSQVHEEAKDLWLSRVLFFFDDTDAMLRKLNTQPLEHVKNIKNLLLVVDEAQAYAGTADRLMLIEGLDVDRMIVYGAHHKHVESGPRGDFTRDLARRDFVHLLGRTDCWKQLYFLVPTRCLLNDSCFGDADPVKSISHGSQCTKQVKRSSLNSCFIKTVLPEGQPLSGREVFINLFRRTRRQARKAWHEFDAAVCHKQLAILSCHLKEEDALVERLEGNESPRPPTTLPLVRKPRRRDVQELREVALHDTYKSTLDYDWQAEWGHPEDVELDTFFTFFD